MAFPFSNRTRRSRRRTRFLPVPCRRASASRRSFGRTSKSSMTTARLRKSPGRSFVNYRREIPKDKRGLTQCVHSEVYPPRGASCCSRRQSSLRVLRLRRRADRDSRSAVGNFTPGPDRLILGERFFHERSPPHRLTECRFRSPHHRKAARQSVVDRKGTCEYFSLAAYRW